jgi:hypothetical protein
MFLVVLHGLASIDGADDLDGGGSRDVRRPCTSRYVEAQTLVFARGYDEGCGIDVAIRRQGETFVVQQSHFPRPGNVTVGAAVAPGNVVL